MQIRKKLIAVVTVLLLSLSGVGIMAASKPIFSVGTVTAAKGGTVSVPVCISENSGICGLTLSVTYSSALTLTGVTKGSALSSLFMTNPGDFSDNPVNLVFDGMESDATNGIIANLLFTVPNRAGTFDISLSIAEGDLVDENLNPVEAETKPGAVSVPEEGGEGEDENTSEVKPSRPMLAADSINAGTSESVALPIRLSGNTGICGATISVKYDSALTLTGVMRGEALPSLTMTRTGSLSANPVKLVFDGMKADRSNGSIAVLQFTAPSLPGSYEVSVSYEAGDIVDGNLQPLEIVMEKGKIVVGGTGTVVEIGNKKVTLPTKRDSEGWVMTAFYTVNGELCTFRLFPPDRATIKAAVPTSAAYAKVTWWTKTLLPVIGAQKVDLK